MVTSPTRLHFNVYQQHHLKVSRYIFFFFNIDHTSLLIHRLWEVDMKYQG